MLPFTAQQPSEGDQMNLFTMYDHEIMDLISAIHIVPTDETFDAESLFVVVKNILRRTTQIVDNVLQGQEPLENLEEKVSRASFNPLLCTLKQLFSEMACKAPGVETAHKTTISILNKLSSYSWDAKAVLTLAAFALDYEDFFALAHLHSSYQLVESTNIPKHVPATLKHSDIEKYGKRIVELNKIINDMLDLIETIFEVKKLSNSDTEFRSLILHVVDPVAVYWIIITVVACTTQMCCLKSDKDKTQELLPFAQKISQTNSLLRTPIIIRDFEIAEMKKRRKLNELIQTPDEITEVFKALVFAKDDMQPLIDGSTNKMAHQELLPFAQKISDTNSSLRIPISLHDLQIAEMKARRKLKEFLQTPDEITEVFKALVFTKDDMQTFIDGSTNKMVSIDVIKKKSVLLLISGLDISRDDISILKSIYNGILREKRYDKYKIVWIPIVEQWTDVLQKKFEMLRSKMPWYIVQYFSPLAGIKFIKEEWHFENEPIVVMMDLQGDVFNENALHMIRNKGMSAFPFVIDGIIPFGFVMHPPGPYAVKSFIPFGSYAEKSIPFGFVMHPPGPYAIEEYTFFCGGNDNRWIEQFSKKVNVLAEDPITKEAYISIELSCVGKIQKHQHFWKSTKTQNKTESKPENPEIQKLLLSFKNESKWAVLTKWSTRVVSDHGTTILKVLEAFEEWKVNVAERGFEICFKEHHDKFLQTGPLPSTS